ncbi:MAG: tyrosine--tRNA ligase [Actinomycetota bacterium]|nr:tyrosine--tRNA ligase [Actinomycetota bacterium]
MTASGNPLDLVRDRGFVQDITDPDGLHRQFENERVTFYTGFDPSAPSLHTGHLVPVMLMAWLQRLGHRPIVVVGGATGRIGDPSGRDAERALLPEDVIAENLERQRGQLTRLLDLSRPDQGLIVDNSDWLGRLAFLDFLRDIGKHFSVNQMLARDSVRRRLEQREQGISYTEFSYQLLQAYDFAYLYGTERCRLQLGGSDQWGNILSGVELTRRLHGGEVYGLTTSLLLDAQGHKFGKSVGQPIWLDPSLTSPYAYYQFWINTHDDDVVRFLRMFTFLSEKEIDELARMHGHDAGARVAQRRLAQECTRLVHGEDGLKEAQRATTVLFRDEPLRGLDDQILAEAFEIAPSVELPRARLEQGMGVLDLVVEAGAAASVSDARRLVRQGGIYLNNVRIDDEHRVVGSDDLASPTTIVLRVGKKRHFLVRFRASATNPR